MVFECVCWMLGHLQTMTVQHFSRDFANPKINVYNKFVSMFCFLFSFCCIIFLFVWVQISILSFRCLVFECLCWMLEHLKTMTIQYFSKVFANPKINVYNKSVSMFCFPFSFCCIFFFRLNSDFVFKFSVFGFRVCVLDARTPANNDRTTLFKGFCKSKD